MANRTYGLDVVRGGASFVVLGFHGQPLLTWFPAFAVMMRGLAPLAIEFFFGLSGFLIGGILIRAFNRVDRPGLKTVWDFWVRRWFRTLPNYYLWLGINVGCAYLGLRQNNGIGIDYAFFLHNFWDWGRHRFFAESWSLAMEEWFYISFPLVTLAAFWILRNHRRAILAGGLIMIVAPLALRAWVAYTDPTAHWNHDLRKAVPFHLDGIGFGIMTAYFHHYHKAFFDAYRTRRLWSGSVVIVVFALAYMFGRADGIDAWTTTFPWKVLGSTVASFAIALLMPAILYHKRPDTRWASFIERNSIISYSVYLAQLPILGAIEWAAHATLSDATYAMPAVQGSLLVFWLGCCYGISHLCYEYFEHPMMMMREKFARDPDSVTAQKQ